MEKTKKTWEAPTLFIIDVNTIHGGAAHLIHEHSVISSHRSKYNFMYSLKLPVSTPHANFKKNHYYS